MTELSGKAIMVSGASGLIGTSLLRMFSAQRIEVIRLVREKTDHPGAIYWNPDSPEPVGNLSRLESLSAAIHLSGANLFSHRWTAAWKREIVQSRVGTTQALVDVLKKLKSPPRSLLCASAIGIYGDRGDEILAESSSPGTGFLADTCSAWEAEADRAAEAGMRVVHLRFGVVLSSEGGALKKMLPAFRAGLGGRLGSGRQWMSWIAINDLVRAVLHIVETDSLQGPVNLVAPIPVTNRDFAVALARALRRPVALPVPALVLRTVLGQIADDALLASTRAIPERLAASGFHFDLPEINGALRAILYPSARLVVE
jgi:uncharacterized protein